MDSRLSLRTYFQGCDDVDQVSVGAETTEGAPTDSAVYNLLSLHLLSRLHPGDELIAQQLLSNVVFNVDFLRWVFLASFIILFYWRFYISL